MIKIAVIGVGYLGYHHTRILKELEDVDLVGVVDINPERVRTVGEEFDVPYYINYEDVLNKADAFIVSTPTVTHYEIAKRLMEKGKHILIEKPVTATVSQAKELIELKRKGNSIVTVGHIERFNPALKSFRDKVEFPFYFISERLGRFSNRALDVDVIKDLMIHDIDIVFSLVREKCKDIRAVGIPVVTEKIDIANVIIEFEDGSVANLTASRVSAEKVRKVRIFQKSSYFNLDYTIQEVYVTRVYKNNIKRIALEVKKEEPLKLELENFVSAIKGEGKQEISLEEGVFALQIAEKISRLINERSEKFSKTKN